MASVSFHSDCILSNGNNWICRFNQEELKRKKAAEQIQSLWRRNRAAYSNLFERVVDHIRKVRNLAAIAIQRVWKGYRTRRILEEDLTCIVFSWPSTDRTCRPEIHGNFESPDVFKRVTMSYCPVRRHYVSVFPFEERSYVFKYVLNGTWLLHPRNDIEKNVDNLGNVNNILRVSEPPFKKLRCHLFPWPYSRRGLASSIGMVVSTEAQSDKTDGASTDAYVSPGNGYGVSPTERPTVKGSSRSPSMWSEDGEPSETIRQAASVDIPQDETNVSTHHYMKPEPIVSSEQYLVPYKDADDAEESFYYAHATPYFPSGHLARFITLCSRDFMTPVSMSPHPSIPLLNIYPTPNGTSRARWTLPAVSNGHTTDPGRYSKRYEEGVLCQMRSSKAYEDRDKTIRPRRIFLADDPKLLYALSGNSGFDGFLYRRVGVAVTSLEESYANQTWPLPSYRRPISFH